uniref:Uncharacterized protein n=1 Tax=Melopsittacus undulatus TaxID=13146 RepID=A0A8V5G4P0_MELUD
MSHGERACRLFFYPCLKQVEPKLYSKIRKYVSETNESIGDARRQLVGYLLEKDKVWFESSNEWHQGKKDCLRRKTKEWAIRKKGKKLQLSRTAKPRKDHTDVDIFDAVTKGNLSELEKTLKDNDINKLNPSSETLLHVAAANGHATVMEYLISKGAKVDVKDKNGRTPLHRAAEKGHGDAVKALLQSGAYLYSLDMKGKTPLHLAAQNNHSHIVKILAGASIDGKDEKGQPPLSHAVVDSNITETAFNSNHPSIFKILLEYSKDFPSEVMESFCLALAVLTAEYCQERLICPPFHPSPALGCMCDLIQFSPQLYLHTGRGRIAKRRTALALLRVM